MSNTALARLDGEMNLQDLGTVLARSGFFADTKDAAQAIVKVLAGREMGFGPIASMTGIYIVKGRVSLGANLIAAAIKRSGRYNYRIRQHDATICHIDFYEHGEKIGESVFTLDQAKKAGTQNLDKFPMNMLFARALTNGARWHCADIFGGPVYTPEELGARVNEEGEVIELPAEEHVGSGNWVEQNNQRVAQQRSTAYEPTPAAPPASSARATKMAQRCREIIRELGDLNQDVSDVVALDFDSMDELTLERHGKALRARLGDAQAEQVAAAVYEEPAA